MIKILIIEDHKILIDGIRALIANDPVCKIYYEALNGETGLEMVKTHSDIDVVLLDINLPDMSGVDICKQIRKISPQLPVLTLTMHESSSYLREMIHAGTNGYVLKNTSAVELVKAIQTIAEGKRFFSEKVKQIMNSNIDLNLVASERNKTIPPRLTVREIEVLQYIIREYTTDQIANELFISSHTVISHRKNILKKFKVKNTAGIVKTVYENDVLVKQILNK